MSYRIYLLKAKEELANKMTSSNAAFITMHIMLIDKELELIEKEL